MLIFRVENAEGSGPFQDPEAADAADLYVFNGDPEFPSPATDKGLGNKALNDHFRKVGELHSLFDTLVGCASLDQLRHWFDRARCVTLQRLGFDLTVWDCPDCAALTGSRQVVFAPDLATLVERKPLLALWDEAFEPQLALPLAA